MGKTIKETVKMIEVKMIVKGKKHSRKDAETQRDRKEKAKLLKSKR